MVEYINISTADREFNWSTSQVLSVPYLIVLLNINNTRREHGNSGSYYTLRNYSCCKPTGTCNINTSFKCNMYCKNSWKKYYKGFDINVFLT